jgi:hypothetical protein
MIGPFPGVDPYLEMQGFWPDFHASFITYWRDSLAEILPENYEARMNERVSLVETQPERMKRIGPDVSVVHTESGFGSFSSGAATATLEPVTIALPVEEEVSETYIEVLHRPDQTLVAILELLSPSNKEEPGRSAYLEKRRAVVRQRVHFVELDLLLGGHRLPMRESLPAGDFYALVSRAQLRPDSQAYRWTVRDALPQLPIPLLAPDPDIRFNLGEVFAYTYRKGRYARAVNYDAPPPATLDEPAQKWARERIGDWRSAPTSPS